MTSNTLTEKQIEAIYEDMARSYSSNPTFVAKLRVMANMAIASIHSLKASIPHVECRGVASNDLRITKAYVTEWGTGRVIELNHEQFEQYMATGKLPDT